MGLASPHQEGYVSVAKRILYLYHLSDGALCTYIALILMSQPDRFPSVDLIAYRRDKSQKTIRSHLKELEAVGLVRPIRQGAGRTCVYAFFDGDKWNYPIVDLVQPGTRQQRKERSNEHFTEKQFRNLCSHYRHTCLCCFRKEPDITLVPDHVVPLALGGSDGIRNIQCLCSGCNRAKGATTLDLREDHWFKGDSFDGFQ